MSLSLRQAVESAHIAYKTHVGTLKWRQKQLHGLVKIVCENRDHLYTDLNKSLPITPLQFELEIEAFVCNVKEHLDFIDSIKHTHSVKYCLQSVGVSVIVSESDDPFRHGLLAMAASIAAGNTVVLVFQSSSLATFVGSLQKLFKPVLDPTGIRILQGQHYLAEAAECDTVDHALVISDNAATLDSLHDWHYLPITPGFNVVVVDRDYSKLDSVVRSLSRNQLQESLPQNRTHAIFVDGTVKDKLLQLLDAGAASTHFHSQSAPADLAKDLQKMITHLSKYRTIPVFTTTSLDHSIDCLSTLRDSRGVSQISIYSDSSANTEYFRSFTSSDIFSVGEIVDRPPIVRRPHGHGTVYPASYFGKYRFQNHTTVAIAKNVAQIRARYVNLIKPLKPEPRGERINFFVQMAWFVKFVKVMMGVTGLGVAWSTVWLVRKYGLKR